MLHPDGQPPQQREALARVVLRQTRSSGHHAPCSQRPPRDEVARSAVYWSLEGRFEIHVQKIKKFANIIIRLLYFDETGRRNNGKRCVLIE